MKKIFPVIILLITLSLAGIIIIQVSWFRSMMENKEEELDRKVIDAISQVASDLTEQKGTLPSLRNSRLRPSFSFPSDQMMKELMKPPTIAEKFTEFEINEKINNTFKKIGLKSTRFEFAVVSTAGLFNLELKSKKFVEVMNDTIRNKRFLYPFLQNSDNINFQQSVSNELLVVIIPDIKNQAWRELRWILPASILFTLILVSTFYITVRTMLRQKNLGEIKNDFINNMTHEFKTPLATISLAVDALKNEKVMQSREKMQYFSDIIKEENRRMNKQVETILQAALMDRQEIKLNRKSLHVHDVIGHVIDNFNLQLQDKNGQAFMNLNATNDLVYGDEVHITNLISNLIDNAVKYSKDNLILRVSTTIVGESLQIKIEDNGIGMSKESLKKIFEKFYRAHTGNVHNVKGFGLGLSYVKTIIDAHNGKIKVDSVLGKGTVFTIELPLQTKEEVVEEEV
ncbi:sensor histidine kinase [Pinibacter soli]|uniref:histidine kinase n=1 Tax=Pinibacter soli TaxID=3044211 RepID=A0ABT6R6Z4_9BACT|nr:HAMP domain-containing sensor histidine kinase [Pinibacter soli]MDI3318165.1 HAMP domain-containing sensor histidine kinase [Pinibacter soli]